MEDVVSGYSDLTTFGKEYIDPVDGRRLTSFVTGWLGSGTSLFWVLLISDWIRDTHVND
jgi:hypothetical protein